MAQCERPQPILNAKEKAQSADGAHAVNRNARVTDLTGVPIGAPTGLLRRAATAWSTAGSQPANGSTPAKSSRRQCRWARPGRVSSPRHSLLLRPSSWRLKVDPGAGPEARRWARAPNSSTRNFAWWINPCGPVEGLGGLEENKALAKFVATKPILKAPPAPPVDSAQRANSGCRWAI